MKSNLRNLLFFSWGISKFENNPWLPAELRAGHTLSWHPFYRENLFNARAPRLADQLIVLVTNLNHTLERPISPFTHQLCHRSMLGCSLTCHCLRFYASPHAACSFLINCSFPVLNDRQIKIWMPVYHWNLFLFLSELEMRFYFNSYPYSFVSCSLRTLRSLASSHR